MHKTLLPLILAYAGIGAAAANPLICEHSKCAANEYSLVKSPRCDKACVDNTVPPGVELIKCDYAFGSYSCEVWPRGKEVSYSYSVSAGMTLSWSGPTYTPFVTVGCPGTGRGGTLFVTVTSPYGVSSHDWVSLPCRTTIEQ
jgi:hypothetical protein